MSSTCRLRCGKISETSMPLCPYFLNENGLGINGPGKPWRTITSPRTLPSIGSPAYFCARAWDRTCPLAPAAAQEQRNDGGGARLVIGAFGANGFTPVGAAEAEIRLRRCGEQLSRPSR